ncbi:peptidyl-prolyl cis-trans isomerase [Oceanobacillus picturae]|uniref:Peptidyl-prolyl cis-trans isomerase n=1 Tax=Oceanobacillus picturae TaxID=171693 RepID=W9AIF9_9BACI|nr:peptidylprolyl isomerase [Oceanobacillus picturae]GAQ19055.1 peptidyl-prolyl cis-trans isomerase [Oceanobacillus picturae]CDO02461.1 putative peptidyl-prolyl cis-trans isomerase [Oceanobacillus picturae]
MKSLRNRYKLMIAFLAIMLLIALLNGCGSNTETEENDTEQDNGEESTNDVTDYPEVNENPIVTITMENDDQIIAELYPKVAPNTVANFISLIEDGFYDGLTFHRIEPGFVIQGGDPEGNGTGGPGYSIAGEFESNGVKNDLIHDRGVLSMARSQSPDSAGSQFFIMLESSPHLDGDYAAFGEVTEGMDTVDEIVAAGNSGDTPVMKKVEVDTKGYDYPEPEKQ